MPRQCLFAVAKTLHRGRGMSSDLYTASEAARALGISLDTLRRWDRAGRIQTKRDAANRRLVPASEVRRLQDRSTEELSARNRFRGVVRAVEVEGFLARVELDLTAPARVVAIITREAAEELDLKPGRAATAIVKSTSVMVER
jgi:molybdopterin-binding protein